MKRVVTSSRTINIEIFFSPSLGDELVTSETYVEARPASPNRSQYTKDQLLWYNNFIANVIQTLVDYNFTIINHYQSSEGYAYYIKFDPVTVSGEHLGNFDIKFRLAEYAHPGNQLPVPSEAAHTSSSSRKTILEDIRINEVSEPGLIKAMEAIWVICDGLSRGDVGILDTFASV